MAIDVVENYQANISINATLYGNNNIIVQFCKLVDYDEDDIDEVDVNAKDNDGNTALMYIVKNMAQKLNIDLKVSSILDQGTVVSLNFN